MKFTLFDNRSDILVAEATMPIQQVLHQLDAEKVAEDFVLKLKRKGESRKSKLNNDPNVLLNFQAVQTLSSSKDGGTPEQDLLDGLDLNSFTLGTQMELKKISNALKAQDPNLQGP